MFELADHASAHVDVRALRAGRDRHVDTSIDPLKARRAARLNVIIRGLF